MEDGPLPSCPHTNNYKPQTRKQMDSTNLRPTVNSDYTGDTTHRKSVTGLVIRIAGDCVYYRTRFQSTVSLSSTEAEFIVAYEAAKVVLYIRSIFDDIGIPQY